MDDTTRTNVLVIGGGPGGYVAAIRAGQLGLDTTLIESGRLGGTCLMRGCIPSKALIHLGNKLDDMSRMATQGSHGIHLPGGQPEFDLAGAMQWKNDVVGRLETGVSGLLKRAGVRVVHGWATFRDAKTCDVCADGGQTQTLQAEHVILATGSTCARLPDLPFDDFVISSTQALELDTLPEHIAVVGAGYIGLELGITFCKMGARVSVVEAMDHVLPGFDRELSTPVAQWLADNDVDLITGATVSGTATKNGARGLAFTDADHEQHELPCDRVLVTVGRQPLTEGWGLDNMGIDRDGGFVRVDDQCRTSMRHVWAIGDLAGPPLLAHKASAQGHMVAEIIAGQRRSFDPVAIPAVCYTDPEVVSVGMTPEQAENESYDTTTSQFPLAANGRALSMEADANGGFVRVIARQDNHVVLGIQAVGTDVADLSGEFTLALEMGACLEDLAGTIHAHPTLSEALPEAALMSLGSPVHF